MTKPSNMLSSQDVIERLCKLQERVSEHFKHRFSGDCFCGKGGQWLWNKEYGGTYEQGYRNSGYALKFIEHVVHRRLAQAPGVYEPRDWGFDPEEHSHQKVAERIMVSRQLWRRRALTAERKLRQAHAQDSDYRKLQGSGSVQTPLNRAKVTVDAEALRQLLTAVTGPEHWLRELLATKGLPMDNKNPIHMLIDEYNAWAKKLNEAHGGTNAR